MPMLAVVAVAEILVVAVLAVAEIWAVAVVVVAEISAVLVEQFWGVKLLEMQMP